MDETAHEIEAHIDRTRERLGSNLKELEQKVDAATDWREQFRARPYLFMGGACLGGALLAAALRPKSPRRVLDTTNDVHLGSDSRSGVDAGAQALELWNNVRVRSSAWPRLEDHRIHRRVGSWIRRTLRRAEQRPDARRA